MLTNLRVYGRYRVDTKNEKIKFTNETLSVKEIPFIRYHLNDYDDADIEYINSNCAKFDKSVPIIEVALDDLTVDKLDRISSSVEKEYAVFVYTEITNEDTAACTLGEERLQKIRNVWDNSFMDSVVLIDRTTDMAKNHILTFKNEIKSIDKQIDVSICNSPFSFSEDACLTALKARELLAEYSDKDECAIPSARHQCMNCCSCIRHIDIKEDIIAVDEPKKEKAPKAEKKTDKPKEPKAEKEKVQKPKKGVALLDW